ncbi:MAG: fluoride efflux transporter CrcB [Proteobacteria bacterium]|nr:MAG: fluoride efflux transporter CrcB [Pseudomonadota bacterium]
MLILAVALGGALGAVLRYAVVTGAASAIGRTFPFGTLAVNIVGSFLIGMLFVWFQARGPHHEILRASLIVGLLGGFTTFSAFSLETLNLFVGGHPGRAALNVVLNVSLCLAAAAAGVKLSKSLFA